MEVSKKALWFGWFEQNLDLPWEPDFMRKERERKEAGHRAAKPGTAKIRKKETA